LDLKIYVDSPNPSSDSSSTQAPTSRLVADRTDCLLPQKLIFEHASGEFFVARSICDIDFGVLYDDIYATEFKVGSDGKVKEVGIAWTSTKIWLQRVIGE
jgi:hypothetical protein